MINNDIRSIVQDELQKNATKNQYGVSKIASHIHDGIGSQRIFQKDIIPNTKSSAFLFTTLTSGGTEIDSINNVPNLTSISFMGFAANNATGGSATKRAIINGHAEIGTCSLTNGTNNYIPTSGISILQMSNSMYIDSTDLTKNRVAATNGNVVNGNYTGIFCYVIDDTNTVLVNTVISYTNSILTFTTVLASGWKLQGGLILK